MFQERQEKSNLYTHQEKSNLYTHQIKTTDSLTCLPKYGYFLLEFINNKNIA